MWKLLSVLVVLANLFLIVCSDNGTAATAATTNVSSTTIIETHHHHGEKCAVNEKYVKCPAKLCQPQVCKHVGFPQCSSHEEKYFHGWGNKSDLEAGIEEPCPGLPACVCIENYVRNRDGICMSAKNCPSCGKDKNSTFGAGVNCGRRCSNYDKGPVSCADVFYINSCDCKEGYVFDDYSGYCVMPEDCSNKDPPKPEGNEGTPGNGEGKDAVTDPCDDCEEKNCDVQGTTRPDGGERTCTTEGEGTEDPNTGDSSTFTTAANSENLTTSQATNRPKKTTKTSSGNLSQTTKESEEGTTQNNENQGEDENKTMVHSKSINEPGLSITASRMSTEKSEPEVITGDSGMETTTGGFGPEDTTGVSGMETTTGGSEPEETTGVSGMETTTGGSGPEDTTGVSGMETTTGGSGPEVTTEVSGTESTT